QAPPPRRRCGREAGRRRECRGKEREESCGSYRSPSDMTARKRNCLRGRCLLKIWSLAVHGWLSRRAARARQCCGLAWCSGSGPLRRGLEIGQALFDLAAHHLLAVHDEANGLADEVVLASHGPCHRGLIALGLERELRLGRAFERLDEVDVDL